MGVVIILIILLLKTLYHVVEVSVQESMPLNKALLYQVW